MNLQKTILSLLRRDIRWSPYLTALLVFSVAVLVFIQYGFEGTLLRDDAIYLYSGQQLAQGVSPYISIFDVKGPIAPFLSGIGASIASLLNLDDILVVRITFLVISSLAAVGVCLLGSALFNSQRLGLLSAFTFIGFSGFGIHAASGPRAKTPMVLFVALSLWLVTRKKWFWAGICGSLAMLAWQPAGIYALVVVLLAFLQSEPGRPRRRNVLFAISGVSIPVVVICLYFWSQGALYDFIDGTFLFHLLYAKGSPYNLIQHLLRPVVYVNTGFRFMALPIFIGFFMVLFMYLWRLRLSASSFRQLLRQDRFTALLLTFPVIVVWTIFDFQSYPDLYVFLPYVAVGFGWLLYLILQNLPAIKLSRAVVQKLGFSLICIVLLASVTLDYYVSAETGLKKQHRLAQQIESEAGPGGKIVSIGAPQVMVLLHRTNPNPYLFITDGIDERIDAVTPGGFDAWLNELKQYDPAVVVLGHTEGIFVAKLMNWLWSNYRETMVGDWRMFVRNPP